MHLLHRALDTDGELRAVVDDLSSRISENPLKQGLILDLNPFWLAAIGFEQSGLGQIPSWRLLDFFGERYPGWHLRFLRLGAASSLLRLGAIAASIDIAALNWSSTDALEITQSIFGRPLKDSPFLLRVFAYPADDVPTIPPEGTRRSVDDGARNRLVEAARQTPIPTIVETQPPARFIAASGDRFYSPDGRHGTLGGFLKDGRSGAMYGVTCGHVIAKGDDAVSAEGLLGRVEHAASPKPLQPGVICDRHCHEKTDLDVALIDLKSARANCTAASVVETVSNGTLVEMNGALSGRRLYEVGPVAVDVEIKGTCWDRLFVFHAPISNSVLDPGVNVLLTPMPVDGDSGAWLFRNGDQWAGMVIATTPLLAFALAGTTIIANSNSSFSTNLTLPSVSPLPKPARGWRAFADLFSGLSR